ncbi:OmpH family outer membrane protein [Mangrovimonas spongiae]|uniref:OmpH family outer membrane protein n=1 Tax=Mangrovimonas spongiae TaxID=2494697 RepID=A0A428K0D7_9FLAO|nr:OmpH family outer membrane protein [Mangrovimonas spongiae]RSK39816.1 OmpH family outer membrane protein [Mangrovimonas spongiae]
MKIKVLFLLTLFSFLGMSHSYAQRGVRIGYIDTEYILENIPEYQEATAQLESKVQKWKGEIESQLSTIEQKRKDLSNEKPFLTKELIEEKEEDIAFEEQEILDYQQKRFGPNGDLIVQKQQLIKPIQDQIFTAVQDMAEKRKYDFVFDKSADVVMLYSADRYDFSDEVIRSITRSTKRKQAQSRAERRQAEQEEVLPEINEKLEAREKAAEERRQEILDERAARKEAIQKRRDSIIAARQAAREAKLKERQQATEDNASEDEDASENKTDANNNDGEKTREQILEERRQKKLEDRARRKKELEERRQRILAERQKAKEEREQERQEQENNDNEDEQEN